MNHSIAKSREVLQINDKNKLYVLLAEQNAELKKLSLGFGRKRMTPIGPQTKPITNKKAIQNTKRHIARIQTRLSQLRQQEMKSK